MNFEKLDEIKINFITGHCRSGTTLLVVLLNQDKNCISTPEIHHFVYFYKKYKNVTKISQALIDDYRSYLSLFCELKKSPLTAPFNGNLFNTLKIGDAINYNRLTKFIYLCLTGDKDPGEIKFIVDKNPYYTFHTDKIFEVFPEAKVLAPVRDYRAYILSNRQSRKPFTAQKPVSYYAIEWNYYIKKILACKLKYTDRIKVLKYEELVSDKENGVKNITDFFGMNYSETLFNFYPGIREKLKSLTISDKTRDRMIKKLSDLSAPVNPSRAYSWKTDLSPEEKKTADFLSGSIGSKTGYFAESKIAFTTKIILSVKTIFIYLKINSVRKFNTPRVFHYLNVRSANKRKKYLETFNA